MDGILLSCIKKALPFYLSIPQNTGEADHDCHHHRGAIPEIRRDAGCRMCRCWHTLCGHYWRGFFYEVDLQKVCRILSFFCSSSIVPYHFSPHPLVLSMPRRAVRGPCTPLSTLTCDPHDPCSFRYDAAAKKSGARIVHACGYDSIPSDLGALMGKCCHQCMLSQNIYSNILHVYIF